ncbi:hypothetical protein AB0M45_26805 [Nocardia sp. NPDC051787]|uniref:hypothetical protein n=1 Tax=Nocardia sp. NPDC051787 TaxID=3155415 RepID=UPI0034131414
MASQHPKLRSPAELIVVTYAADATITPIALRESRSVQSHVGTRLPEGGELVRIFGPANRLQGRLSGTARERTGTEYLNYFYVRGVDSELDELAVRLRDDDAVAAAYVKPPAEPPIAPHGIVTVTAGSVADAPPVTPDFLERQGYLDAALYDIPPPEFPATWHNPFRGGAADSGAIIVGAGTPPPGFHGRDHGPARSRLAFSNYGKRVDAQGWGLEVTTTGYGDLQGGSDEDLWYTDVFSGTSSASPIVTGAVASYQGMSGAAAGRKTPGEVRTRLRETGSPQTDAPARPATQRIGTLPDLRSLLGP